MSWKKLVPLAAAALVLALLPALWLLRPAETPQIEWPSAPGHAAEPYGRSLVVYFSHTGGTESVARRIAELTGANTFELIPEGRYPNSALIYLTAKWQLARRRYPALSGPLPNLTGYDTVFLGSPVWWFTASPPLLSYLAAAEGATILPGASFEKVGQAGGDSAALDERIRTWLAETVQRL